MLVLSRKRREAIVIDGNITVTVLEIKGGRVRLGLTAPKEVPIHRAEVHGRISMNQPQQSRTLDEDIRESELLVVA